MKKTFLALVAIFTITVLSCCIRTVSVNQTELYYETTTEQPSSDTEETTSQEETSSESPTVPDSTEQTTLCPIIPEGPIAPNSFSEHGKELMVYGDIDANDPRVISLGETLINYSKKISLVVWRKDGTRALSYNTSQTFFSACTIKTGFILNCCKIIDSGAVDENTLLTYEQRHYHRGSGQIKYSAYGTQYSIKTLINLCLSISDNVAYEMLSEYFGFTQYNEMVEALGCDSLKLTKLWGYNVKAKDYIVIWNEVYDYFASGAKMAADFKEACTNTPFNYGTETLEGTGIDYSHKSGDNFGTYAAYNDAGIVWEDNVYIYAVFTNSEGTGYDINTVNTAMDLARELMK